MDSTSNPLAGYFRKPGVQVKLPSNGAFMPKGSVDFTMTGEVPVYPMRGSDELLLKSPDALMSGYAIEELLKSCVPAIKLPRLVSSPDLDVLLLAIRAATYGEVISIAPICPACKTENEIHRNLSYLMSTMKFIPPENSVRLNEEVVVYIRPYNLLNATKIGTASFEEARKLQALNDDTDPTERAIQINNSMRRITDLTVDAMADCVFKVVVPDNEVCDPHMIREFVKNIGKAWTDGIQAKLDDINECGIDKHYDVKCINCAHEWKAAVEFNPSTFFAASSSA